MRWRLLLLIAVIGCGSRGLSPREGYVQVPGGRVWYRIVGSGTRTPLLVLHGGPGVPSTYLKPLAALADERPVVFYDQLGTGKSDHPTDTTLWRMERYLEELNRVRQALGLREVHLYGHSWGSILAVEYLLTRPAGVRSLILAGPGFSIARYLHDADSLLATLPDSIQAVVRGHEETSTCDAPAYQAALFEFYKLFFARQQPWSADLDSAVARVDPSSSDHDARTLHLHGKWLIGKVRSHRSARRVESPHAIRRRPLRHVDAGHDALLPKSRPGIGARDLRVERASADAGRAGPLHPGDSGFSEESRGAIA